MESKQNNRVTCYTALDLETTGLDPKKDKIIEIGAAKVVDGVVTQTYSKLVKPGRNLSDIVTELTGITDELLAEEAIEPEDAIRELLDFLGDDYLLGHSILFDFSFVKRCAVNEKLTYEAEAIDTLKLARKYLTELPSRSLPALCEYFQIQRKSHRALEDALATVELYEKLCEQYYDADEFMPQKLIYQVKRESPASKRQKDYLRRLVHFHGIDIDYDIERLTKNEASRYTDQIILKHGRMPRDNESS